MKKKIFFVFLIICLCILSTNVIASNSLVPISSKQLTEEKILIGLKPYIEVIDKINKEYGSSMCILDMYGAYDYIYGNGIDLDQYELQLRKDYNQALRIEQQIKEHEAKIQEYLRENNIQIPTNVIQGGPILVVSAKDTGLE